MTAYSSDNYLWLSKDILGRGAYGEVYKCRHKKNGNIAAVKIFKGYSSADKTEIDILQQLRHPNIIKVLAVENCDDRRKGMIMEYCSGKSLHHFLEEPQNCYGMDDRYFLIFLRDITAALRYLQSPGNVKGDRVVHRDIKPLNILISYTDRGQPIFKLSDFGTAKVIANTQEECNTLVGTPEYLQPDMFNHYTHQPNYIKGVFHSRAVDLWPLGATIYYAACGSLPFRPFGSLTDSRVKNVMCEMIKNKDKGVISGVQESYDGDIVYRKTLPESCNLSKHLQSLIVPLLVELLVARPRDEFDPYKMVDGIESRKFVRYFLPHLAVLDRVYVAGDLTPDSLWDEISNLHNKDDISRSNFQLWWNGFPVDHERVLSQIDSVLECEPVMLIGFKHVPASSFEFTPLTGLSIINSAAASVRVSDPVDDKKFARLATGNIIRMLNAAEHLRDIQLHLNKCARYFDAYFKSRVATVHSPTLNLSAMATRVAAMFNSLKGVRDVLPGNSGVESMNELFNQIAEMCCKTNSIQRKSDELNINLASNVWTDEDLCTEECEQKIKCQARFAKEILADFKADLEALKERRTPYGNHDIGYVHKLDRMQLCNFHETTHAHIKKECIPNTQRLLETLSGWSEDIYKKLESVDQLEKDFTELNELQETLQKSTERFGEELSEYIKLRVRSKRESSSDKSELFQRARHALEESSKTLEQFRRRNPPQ